MNKWSKYSHRIKPVLKVRPMWHAERCRFYDQWGDKFEGRGWYTGPRYVAQYGEMLGYGDSKQDAIDNVNALMEKKEKDDGQAD